MPVDPLMTTALSGVGAWVWDKYGKSVTDKTAGAVKSQWDKFRWKDAADKYRAKIIKLYGTMQIMGMAEPVPLDDIFTDAYMLDKPTAFVRHDIERLKELSADPEALPPQEKRISGLRLVIDKGREGASGDKKGLSLIKEQAKSLLSAFINRNVIKGISIKEQTKNLFVLGKPGAGKTTFLKYIALQAAEQNINSIPIFISLKRWADSGSDLMTFITDRFDICDFPAAQPFVEELLKSGNAIVLFDGLDEVNQESGQRDNQTRAINDFMEKYDRTQCLITCRIAASDYSFKPFTYVEIADFTEQQIETFVSNWFRNNEGERDKETCERFLTEFKKEDNEGLRDLARTPLLLTLLCLGFNETLTFPQRRVEIYEEALDALLKKWDSSRRVKRDEVYRKLSLGHKENMLARIASDTFERNEYFIPQLELENLIADFVRNIPPHDTNEATDGETILKAIESQHGIFVERARGIYSFSHLTFQEYFTAKYNVDNAAQGTLTNLVNGHYADGRWREVFLLTTSMLSDAGQFMLTFRRVIDELLGDDEKLRALLTWAERKSTSAQAISWLVRPYYLYVALHYDSPNRAIDLALTRARDRALDLIPAHDLYLDLDLIRAIDIARARDRALELTSDRALDLALSLDRAHASARTHARDLGLNELAGDLTMLSPPNAQAFTEEWEVFADRLQGLAMKHRHIEHMWFLTDTQEKGLADYINATRLLEDCLELAFMSREDKKAILESLYLPLGRADEEQ